MKKQIRNTLAIGLVALAGCTTPYPEAHVLPRTLVVCADETTINKEWNKRPNDGTPWVNGFTYSNQVYVKWSAGKDKNGEPMPDFYTLGHEIWHRIKGDYHE